MKEYRLNRRRPKLKLPIFHTLVTFFLCILVISDYIPIKRQEEVINVTVILPKETSQIPNPVYEEYTLELKMCETPQIRASEPDETLTLEWDHNSNDILNVTNATAEQFDQLVEYIIEHRDIKDPSLRGIGHTLVEVEELYGISGVAILSIITWESGFGDVCIKDNNLGGIKIGNEYVSFNSADECILYMGELLNTYVSNGLTSWEDIGGKYCDYTWSVKIPETIKFYNEIMYNFITTESIA